MTSTGFISSANSRDGLVPDIPPGTRYSEPVFRQFEPILHDICNNYDSPTYITVPPRMRVSTALTYLRAAIFLACHPKCPFTHAIDRDKLTFVMSHFVCRIHANNELFVGPKKNIHNYLDATTSRMSTSGDVLDGSVPDLAMSVACCKAYNVITSEARFVNLAPEIFHSILETYSNLTGVYDDKIRQHIIF